MNKQAITQHLEDYQQWEDINFDEYYLIIKDDKLFDVDYDLLIDIDLTKYVELKKEKELTQEDKKELYNTTYQFKEYEEDDDLW